MTDVEAMRIWWRSNGPPANFALVAIAASLGIDLINLPASSDGGVPLPREDVAPSIANLAQAVAVQPGHDTWAASKLIAEKWKEAADG